MPKSVPKEKSLASVNPELASEWHPTKNGDLTPFDITSGSGKKVWWKCDEGDDHDWDSSPNNRTKDNGRGCPICSGYKVVKSNCLSTVNPELSSEWHPNKNGNLTPQDVTSGTHKKVWWKCNKGDDHEWKTSVAHRTNGRSCPICAGKKVVKSNCLLTVNPELASEWHPNKNGNLTPQDVTSGTHKKVWWKCNKGDDHEWKANILSRTRGVGCPICAGQKVVKSNSLLTINPKLASEWHSSRNGDLTPTEVSIGSGKRVWWKCDKGDDHEWEAIISTRAKGSSCPFCSGHKVAISNSLANTHPDLANQWHPTKNKKLTPSNVSKGSNSFVWWKCNKGDDHEWKAIISSRTTGVGCPICAGQKVVKSNSLLTINPKLASEWHSSRNGDLTPTEVSIGSRKRVWWKCDKGDDHEWEAIISNRSRGRGCPFCKLTPQSRQELIITFELLTIFKGINPKGFKLPVDGKLRSIDIYIPNINLGIEFDGAYWHKGKIKMDKLKTQELESVGLNIIRVRQKPLKRIFDSDVMAEKKYDGKAITNDILRQILKDYNLNKRIINKIHAYLDKTKLQNENGLNKYIDMILDEKAERKIIKTPE
jgi:hypothetical protein